MQLARSTLFALLLCMGLVLPATGQPTAFVGGTVHPVSGPEIADGVVLLRGDTIAAVGTRCPSRRALVGSTPRARW